MLIGCVREWKIKKQELLVRKKKTKIKEFLVKVKVKDKSWRQCLIGHGVMDSDNVRFELVHIFSRKFVSGKAVPIRDSTRKE